MEGIDRMERDQVLDLLRKRAVDLFEVPEDRFVLTASLRRDFDLDSLDVVEYTVAIEDDFGIRLDGSALQSCENIGDFVDVVRDALREQAAS
jgi:acyl carrier protein